MSWTSACSFFQPHKEAHRVVRESRLSIVMLSNPRLMPGHTLVIPKRHIEKPDEPTKVLSRKVAR